MSPAKGGKYWATGSSSKPIVSRKLASLFVALSVLLGATSGLVLYLSNQNSSTPFVSIIALDYQYPWAPNAWAKEDQVRFETLGASSQFVVAGRREKLEGTWQELLELELEKVTPGGPGGSLLPTLFGYQTMMVHLSAHGVINSQGEPCLIFSDAAPLDEQTWVPLKSVLGAIAEHPVVVGSDARVLVLLDTGKQPPDMQFGLLCAGFAEEAKLLIQTLPYQHFAVLMACGENQLAWSAPEIGGSVFGFMVASGLKGLADELSGDDNSRVTVRELEAFVASTVNGYVREHRGRVQNPHLVWAGENQDNDFELCFRSTYAASDSAGFRGNSKIQKVTDAWLALEDWSARTSSVYGWQRASVVGRLAHAERLLWAGDAYEDQVDEEVNRIQRSFLGTPASPWPAAICGASLTFLREVNALGPMDQAWNLQHAAATDTVALPNSVQANGNSAIPPSGTSSDTSTASTDSQTPASESGTGLPADSAEAANVPSAIAETNAVPPIQQAIAWLQYETPPAGDGEPPAAPPLPSRPDAVEFLYEWFSATPGAITPRIVSRGLEWIGPIGDSQSVTREEALIRTMHDHLLLTESWGLEAADRLGELWSQYLSIAGLVEQGVATTEPRATQSLEAVALELLTKSQMVRDHIHGCQTQRDASDCAVELELLQQSALSLIDAQQRLQRGWKIRDELILELPVLAEWLSSPLSRLQPLSPTAAWDRSRQLLVQLEELQRQLSVGEVPLDSMLDQLDHDFEELVAAYSRCMYDLLDVSAKGQRLPLGNLVLSLGLRPTLFRGMELESRGRLHNALQNRFRDFSGTVSEDKLENYCQNILTEGVDESALWQVNELPSSWEEAYAPLQFASLALGGRQLQTPVALTTARGRLAAWGGELRRAEVALPQQLADECVAAIDRMDSLDPLQIGEAEGDLVAAEFRARLIGAVLPADRLTIVPVPEQLHQAVCNQQYALWQTRRALTEFWKTPRLPQAEHQAFLLGSSAAWQAIAARLPPQGPLAMSQDFHQAVAQRSQSWQSVLDSWKIAAPGANEWHGELQLDSFPTGSSWLRLAVGGHSAQLQPIADNRAQLEMKTGSLAQKPQEISLSTQGYPEGSHAVLAWFRGHEASAEVPVYRQEPPITLAWQTEPAAATTLRVEAEAKPARVVFVLDCSGSMQAKPMEKAKNTLLEVIRELGKQFDAESQIAVVAFGHTSEYDTDASDLHSDWQGKKRRPYADVEILQDLVQPSPQVVNELESMLGELTYFGRTPLYEAIIQSIDLLLNRRDGFRGDLRVVVVTDGEDNVFPFADGVQANAKARGYFVVPNEYIHNEQDVIARAQGVSIDFVPFNFIGKAGGVGKLREIAAKTGGKVYGANNNNLAEQLRNSIARDSFTVKNLESGRTIGANIRLADALHVEQTQLPGRFEVRIDNTTEHRVVELLGGETLELQYRAPRGLSFMPYEGDAYAQTSQIKVGEQMFAAQMLTGVPRSVPQVRLLWQSQDETQQSFRPQQFLLEVRRARSGQAGEGPIAWTSDGLWEQNHRSPVLRVALKNLPELEESWLEARLWAMQPRAVLERQAVPLARFRQEPVEVAKGVTVSVETQREPGGVRVVVSEHRQPEAPLVHLEIRPAPDTFSEHQFHTNKVVHEFFYTEAAIEGKLELILAPLPDAPTEQWNASTWLRVPRWVGP
ncbi:vWA domain-containing protein [Aureliella helgolandensis]|uniref:vWA domain-containing protein n=1 Tax=Aureliella helgolandensis TaxID=2527968 RepID=UPI0018D015C6|nr:vWA domain-containing protein [Aureliella helgolandensis]